MATIIATARTTIVAIIIAIVEQATYIKREAKEDKNLKEAFKSREVLK